MDRRHPGLDANRISRLDDKALNRVFEEAFQELLNLDADAHVRAPFEPQGTWRRRDEDRSSSIIQYNTIYKESLVTDPITKYEYRTSFMLPSSGLFMYICSLNL